MNWIDILGTIGFGLVVAAPCTQIWKSLHTKDTREIARMWPALIVLSFVLILPTVLVSNNPILQIGHCAGLIANLVNLVLILIYRRPLL